MLSMVDRLTADAVKGKMPKTTFNFPKELTQNTTLLLYKWIILLDSYESYNDVIESLKGEKETTKKCSEERKSTKNKMYFPV